MDGKKFSEEEEKDESLNLSLGRSHTLSLLPQTPPSTPTMAPPQETQELLFPISNQALCPVSRPNLNILMESGTSSSCAGGVPARGYEPTDSAQGESDSAMGLNFLWPGDLSLSSTSPSTSLNLFPAEFTSSRPRQLFSLDNYPTLPLRFRSDHSQLSASVIARGKKPKGSVEGKSVKVPGLTLSPAEFASSRRRLNRLLENYPSLPLSFWSDLSLSVSSSAGVPASGYKPKDSAEGKSAKVSSLTLSTADFTSSLQPTSFHPSQADLTSSRPRLNHLPLSSRSDLRQPCSSSCPGVPPRRNEPHYSSEGKTNATPSSNPSPSDFSSSSMNSMQDVSQFSSSRGVPAPGNNPKDSVEGNSNRVPSPRFAWATDKPTNVHNLEYLRSNHILKIPGDVFCRSCNRQYTIEYDLIDKLVEITIFISKNKETMHDRAPISWLSPTLPICRFCKSENSVKPIIPQNKNLINWLFLMLGQLLGCCTLEQLKHFCEQTKNHRTGAKDRVLYSTYLGLCKQLIPSESLFDD